MKATINVSLRIPDDQAKVIQKEAKRQGLPLATFIRNVAYMAALEAREAK